MFLKDIPGSHDLRQFVPGIRLAFFSGVKIPNIFELISNDDVPGAEEDSGCRQFLASDSKDADGKW